MIIQADSTFVALNQLSHIAIDFAITAIVLSGVGALLLQALYDLGVRARTQRRLVVAWLKDRFADAHKYHPELYLEALRRTAGLADTDSTKVMNANFEIGLEVVMRQLSAGRADPAFFGLSYQQLAAQIAAAVQSDLEDGRMSLLVVVFAASADKRDLHAFSQEKIPAATKDSDITRAEIAARIAFHAERGLDDLQVKLGRFWVRRNYELSLAVTLITLFLLVATGSGTNGLTGKYAAYAALGIAGTLIVPVLRTLLERHLLPAR